MAWPFPTVCPRGPGGRTRRGERRRRRCESSHIAVVATWSPHRVAPHAYAPRKRACAHAHTHSCWLRSSTTLRGDMCTHTHAGCVVARASATRGTLHAPAPQNLVTGPLKRLHRDLLQQYDCTEQAAPQPPPSSAGGSAAANAGAHPQPPAGSQDLIQAEAGFPLSVLQLSRPAGPAAPEVRHPYPAPCHGAAHQALGALQGPASALRRHAFRGAAHVSSSS